MSGEIDSTEQDQQKVTDLLKDYEEKIGIPSLMPPGEASELEKYLTMGRDVIERLSIQDCSQIAYRLQQFAYYVQRLYNKECGIKVWAEHCINYRASKQFSKYNEYYWKHDIKISHIIRQDEYLQKLNKILNYAEQRMINIQSITNSLHSLSLSMTSNKYAKAQGNSNYE